MRRAAVLLSLALAWARGAFAEPVRVPGTQTRIDPPAGFTAASRFPGFQRDDIQASIVVTELPAPFAELKKAMTAEALATKGITLVASTTPTVDGREAILVEATQQQLGTSFSKWMLVTGDGTSSVIVVGTYPRAAAPSPSEAIRLAILSVARSSETADPFEGLLYRVTPSAKLKLAGRMNNLVALTESGSLAPAGPSQGLFIVGNSLGAVAGGELPALARRRILQTTQAEEIVPGPGAAVTLDGLDAYEIVADAKDPKSGTPIKIYQVIAPDSGGYFLIQGIVSAERSAEMLPEFRAAAATFRRAGDR